jgi:hypothetical protein
MNLATITKAAVSPADTAILAAQIYKEDMLTTLTFEDVSVKNFSSINNGYGGFDWSNFYVVNRSLLPASAYDNSRKEEPNVACNAFGTTASIKSNQAFDFQKAYLTAAWSDNLKIIVEGLLKGEKKYCRVITLNKKKPILFNFDFLNIDELKFIPLNPQEESQFALNKFIFSDIQSVSDSISSQIYRFTIDRIWGFRL